MPAHAHAELMLQFAQDAMISEMVNGRKNGNLWKECLIGIPM